VSHGAPSQHALPLRLTISTMHHCQLVPCVQRLASQLRNSVRRYRQQGKVWLRERRMLSYCFSCPIRHVCIADDFRGAMPSPQWHSAPDQWQTSARNRLNRLALAYANCGRCKWRAIARASNRRQSTVSLLCYKNLQLVSLLASHYKGVLNTSHVSGHGSRTAGPRQLNPCSVPGL
jgi:hypothetical protein